MKLLFMVADGTHCFCWRIDLDAHNESFDIAVVWLKANTSASYLYDIHNFIVFSHSQADLFIVQPA